VPTTAAFLAIPLCVGCKQPLHETAEITIRPRLGHKVDVIGHQTPAQQRERNAAHSRPAESEESRVVGWRMEYRSPIVAARDGVLNDVGRGGAQRTRHPQASQKAGHRYSDSNQAG
jgi:hypothetical protein